MSKVFKPRALLDEEKEILIRRFERVTDEEDEQMEEVDVRQSQSIEEVERLAQALIEEAKNEATYILQQAKQEANEVKEQIQVVKVQAQQDNEKARKQAEENGYKDGYEKGRTEGFDSIEDELQAIRKLAVKAEEDYIQTIEAAEPTIINLATALSHRIIQTALEEREDLWMKLVEQVIDEVREQEHVKVYVHPHWYERTLQQKNELESVVTGEGRISVYPDQTLQENGCVIETKFGRIDASLDQQLSQLKQQLHEKLKEAQYER